MGPSQQAPNPVWFKPVMFGFMLLGLAWIIVYYVSGQQYPIASLQTWNLADRLRHRVHRVPHDHALALTRSLHDSTPELHACNYPHCGERCG